MIYSIGLKIELAGPRKLNRNPKNKVIGAHPEKERPEQLFQCFLFPVALRYNRAVYCTFVAIESFADSIEYLFLTQCQDDRQAVPGNNIGFMSWSIKAISNTHRSTTSKLNREIASDGRQKVGRTYT